jgi:phosphate-selective porin OprO/OprP
LIYRTTMLAAVASLVALNAIAQDVAPRPAAEAAAVASEQDDDKTASPFDRVWGAFTELYRDDRNRIVQEVRFTGRFQHDLAVLAADQGEHGESNVRRLRFGPRIRLLRDYLFHAEIELNPQEQDPFYVRFTDLYVEWSRSERLAVTVGKQSIPFTQEGATSSKELLTIDRSNLANNIWFTQEYMPGVSASGEVDAWRYHAGVFSAGAATRELGRFDGGAFTLGAVGYDFGNALGVEELLLTGQYLHQRADDDNTFTQPFGHIASLNLALDAGRWGVRSDVALAAGHRGQSDLRAFMVMPFLDVTTALQLVGRYTLVDSTDANGIRLATYENRIVAGRGDRYDELYAGANYYFYSHRLKLQSGVQWNELDDAAADGGEYRGVSWVTGLRVSW